jgi:hypothetical protein
MTPDHRNPWTPKERKLLASLRTPFAVQRYLDGCAYGSEPIYRSPRSVMRDGKAHCFDGAMFAAAALERLGFPPLLVDLRAVRDDDHVLAVFRVDGCWGAVAKSNFVGLRWRDPVFRSLRELAMSYFDAYFNTVRERSLRSFSRPVSLRAFERLAWRIDDAAMDVIAARLDAAPHTELLTPQQVKRLAPVDERSWAGQTVGTDAKGLYDASRKKPR